MCEFIVMVYAPHGRRFLGPESKAAAFMFVNSSTSSYVTNIQWNLLWNSRKFLKTFSRDLKETLMNFRNSDLYWGNHCIIQYQSWLYTICHYNIDTWPWFPVVSTRTKKYFIAVIPVAFEYKLASVNGYKNVYQGPLNSLLCCNSLRSIERKLFFP